MQRPSLPRLVRTIPMAVSVFDLFKIGIGPSSSHTVGPMRAARLFALRLEHDGLLPHTARVLSQLYGSLGATGKGHGSDKAVLLGLAGHEPDTVDVEAVPQLLEAMRANAQLPLLGRHTVAFREKDDLKFHRRESLPLHANGMRFTAFDAAGAELSQRTYYSVGGGFVVSDEVLADGARQKVIAPDSTVLPHPFHSGDELLVRAREAGGSIAERDAPQRKRHWRTDAEIDAGLLKIWRRDAGRASSRGCKTGGVLPGGFQGASGAPRPICSRRSCPSQPGGRRCVIRCRCWIGSTSMHWRSTKKTPPAAASSLRRRTARPASCPPSCITTPASFPGAIDAARHRLSVDGCGDRHPLQGERQRSPARRSAARGKWAWHAAMAAGALCAVHRRFARSRSRTPPRSAWNITWA